MASKSTGKFFTQVTVSGSSVPLSPQLQNKRLNRIPDGRQLQRTPPSKNANTPISHKSEQPSNTAAKVLIRTDAEPGPVGNISRGSVEAPCPSVKEERKSFLRSSTTPMSAKMGDADAEVFIQGMQGYQWTESDLEFVHQARQRQRVQQLQHELGEVQKTLKDETQRLELAKASRDKLQRELSETPSCKLLFQLCQDLLSQSQPAPELHAPGDGAPGDGAPSRSVLEDRKLLSQLQLADVQQAVYREVAEVARLQRELAKAQELRAKEEQAMKEMDNCQRRITTVKENIKALKLALTELKSQLSEKEKASKAVPLQEKACRAHRTVKAQATSDGPKAQKEKKPKEKTQKEMKICPDGMKEAKKQNLQPAETEEALPAARGLEKAPKAPKMSKSPAVAAILKAPKEKALKDEASKEKIPKDITPIKESPTVPRGSGNSHTAAKPLKALLSPKASEGDARPLRRSKRIAMQNQSLCAAEPQKTACSRRR
ncbi:uncharacterized protein si:dkeyp-34c12.1 isoform X2 [Electrophorus electricus]|uniref:uncharacterized protein si:dkeyp-34c12.1 isoform X2 n=1 Tax=Electrophorus electricus TaxID=8005 RepID=UPI0015CFDB1C|nr:uncharacterized protein si:dkeyp-34c12.1 isoform X2 [Electrophorus electricus]